MRRKACHTPQSLPTEGPRCVPRSLVFRNACNAAAYSAAFVDMLNSMRFGHLTPETVAAFTQLSRKVTYDDGIDPTDL